MSDVLRPHENLARQKQSNKPTEVRRPFLTPKRDRERALDENEMSPEYVYSYSSGG